jgi:hypothetical protein
MVAFVVRPAVCLHLPGASFAPAFMYLRFCSLVMFLRKRFEQSLVTAKPCSVAPDQGAHVV